MYFYMGLILWWILIYSIHFVFIAVAAVVSFTMSPFWAFAIAGMGRLSNSLEFKRFFTIPFRILFCINTKQHSIYLFILWQCIHSQMMLIFFYYLSSFGYVVILIVVVIVVVIVPLFSVEKTWTHIRACTRAPKQTAQA